VVDSPDYRSDLFDHHRHAVAQMEQQRGFRTLSKTPGKHIVVYFVIRRSRLGCHKGSCRQQFLIQKLPQTTVMRSIWIESHRRREPSRLSRAFPLSWNRREWRDR
jgi:hypothetical protein